MQNFEKITPITLIWHTALAKSDCIDDQPGISHLEMALQTLFFEIS